MSVEVALESLTETEERLEESEKVSSLKQP